MLLNKKRSTSHNLLTGSIKPYCNFFPINKRKIETLNRKILQRSIVLL